MEKGNATCCGTAIILMRWQKSYFLKIKMKWKGKLGIHFWGDGNECCTNDLEIKDLFRKFL